MIRNKIRRGDIYYTDLRPVVGSEQGGIRPCLVIKNNIGNTHSPTIIVAAITSTVDKPPLPTHIQINEPCGLNRNSIILLEQIRTIDRLRLKEYIGSVSEQTMGAVNNALSVSFELPN